MRIEKSLRQIAASVETTGLDVESGHRIIEIGAVEIKDRCLTGAEFHSYYNPERDVDPAATYIHRLTLDFLKDKPLFAEELDRWNEWQGNADLILFHEIDLAFLDAELARAGHAQIDRAHFTAVYTIAKPLWLEAKNTLSTVCDRLRVNLPKGRHGAMLDAHAVAEAYLALTKRRAH